MSTIDLLAKVRSLKELEALISEAQAELDGIKDELKSEMQSRNTEELDVDVFKIRYKTVKSNRFDTTAFKSTHKDLYEQVHQADRKPSIHGRIKEKSLT